MRSCKSKKKSQAATQKQQQGWGQAHLAAAGASGWCVRCVLGIRDSRDHTLAFAKIIRNKRN